MANKSAGKDVLTGVYTALNVSGLTSLLGATGVTNDFPADPTYPYVRIDMPNEVRWDTFQTAGKEASMFAHVFSQYRGDIEALDVVSKIIELLHYVAVTVANHTLARFQFNQHEQGADEMIQGIRTTHRIVTFTVNVQET